ncbi:ABC transporter substrate-binding protein [Halocatena salina]|uniref:ABC transporter substrate-binding protein n=1 Tax=Halocatena salina TaxID=2934340 RepID=A0A8U0A956_9EURY|nr:ABC transporter substrate-binding protein [Halocatena salina]UPM44407.1 ABC transporter substrate-binding protein [Halocatena salina]
MVEYGDQSEEPFDRRRFLQLTGVASAVAVAGCANLVNNGDDENESPRHVSHVNQVPADIQWNSSNPANTPQITNRALFDPFVKYNFKTSEFIPYAISEWNFGGNTFELTVRDGLTWSNGDDVTASDIATQLRIGLYTGEPYADFTESIKTPDDSTVRLQFDSTVNEQIVTFQILADRFVHQKESEFGTYLETLKNDEQKGLKELGDFAYREPIASGPFEHDSVGQEQLRLTLRDDHPDADNINFDEYVFEYRESNQQAQQALQNGAIDSAFSLFVQTDILENFPKKVTQIQTPSNWGYGLYPNHSDPHLSDRAVRQAIQYVINRAQVRDNVSPDSKTAPEYPVGIASDNQQEWLGDAIDDFDTYGVDSTATEQATQVLEEAGYKKQNGTWVDSDGETVELPIMVPSDWSDWNTATDTVVDQLSQFGFQATKETRSYDAMLGNVFPNGDFVVAAAGWLYGSPQGSFPYFSLHHQLVKNNDAVTYNYPAADGSRGGNREDVTVPARSGSGTITVNPAERLSELAGSTDESTVNEITVEQAWVTNQDLPMLPVLEKVEQTFITGGEEWDIPKPDAEVAQVQWANTWLPRQGEMQYTGN